MLPERLVIKNFLNFESVDLDFTKIRKALILGVRERDASSSNGSGKSNLLRAIPWCIWGINPESKTMDYNVKWGTEFCSVRLDFSHNGKNISITRTRSLKTKSSTLDLFINGVGSNGNSIDETNAKIVNLLNLDYHAYINSVYINQNDLFSLANSRDKNDSRELLERVLGLNEYDDYFEATKKTIEELEATKATLNEFLSLKQSAFRDIEGSRNLIESSQKDLQESLFQKDTLKKYLEDFASEYEIARDSISKRESVVQKISSSESTLASSERELTGLLERASGFKRDLESKKNRCEDTIATQEAVTKEKSDLDEKIGVNQVTLSRITDINVEIASITTARDGFQTQSSTLEKRLSVLQHEGKAAKTTIQELEAKKNNPSIAIGSKCDMCLSDITQNTLDHYVQHLVESVDTKTKALASHREEAIKLSGENDTAKKFAAEKNAVLSDLGKEKEGLLRQVLSEKTIQYQQDAIAKKMSDIETAKKDLEAIQIGGEVDRWKETIRKKREDIANLQSEIEALRKEANIDEGYQQTVDKANDLKSKISDTNSALGRIEGSIFVLESNLSSLKSKADQFDTIQQDVDQTIQQISEIDAVIDVYGDLLKAFSPRGIRHHILGTAIEDLEREANEILPKISSGNMSISFETKKEVVKSKTGQTEKLTFDAYIHDGEKTLPFNMYSGGEQLRISFVIRVALSKLLLKRANSELEFLILDEALSPLDAAGIELIIPTINALQTYFKKIIVITHRSDVKQYFDEILTVHRDKFTSRVEV